MHFMLSKVLQRTLNINHFVFFESCMLSIIYLTEFLK